MDDAQIIREYHEATVAYELAYAAEAGKDEYLALPQDVRQARARLACRAEIERHREAAIAFDALRANREERYIAAHEVLGVMRRAGTT